MGGALQLLVMAHPHDLALPDWDMGWAARDPQRRLVLQAVVQHQGRMVLLVCVPEVKWALGVGAG